MALSEGNSTVKAAVSDSHADPFGGAVLGNLHPSARHFPAIQGEDNVEGEITPADYSGTEVSRHRHERRPIRPGDVSGRNVPLVEGRPSGADGDGDLRAGRHVLILEEQIG